METNYNLWIEEKYEELCDKLIESAKRSSRMINPCNDDLEVEIFNNKVCTNDLKSATRHVMNTDTKGRFPHPDQNAEVKGKVMNVLEVLKSKHP